MIVAIVPVGRLEGAKSRLGSVLDAEERRDLAERLLTRTIDVLRSIPTVSEVLVVTPDDDARAVALASGARPLRQRSDGLNVGIRHARDEALAAGASAILIVPTDLPGISKSAIEPILDTLTDPGPPLVTMVADRHGRGTNALLLAPPDVIDVRFGYDSRRAHADAARGAGARLVELSGPLALDLDTPDDLLMAEALDPALARG